MEIGKLPNDVLKKLILNKIKNTRDEVLIRPKIGEDCCAVDFGDYICVLSTDPITGTANGIGRLAVHVSCNDIASCGVEPLGLLVTILVPPGATEKELEIVMAQLCETAASINVDILGGHTEVTDAVNRFVVASTALGRAVKGKTISTSGAEAGDDIVMTKSAGIEGTAIIAHDKENMLLNELDAAVIESAKSFINKISVVKEGVVAGGFGATAMHDITEGGVLGAVWEVAEASDVGAVVYKDLIPVAEETLKICRFFGIDPLKLISSGSMLITCKDGRGLVKRLNKDGIPAAVIGKVTKDKSKLLEADGTMGEIFQPGSDELYKVC